MFIVSLDFELFWGVRDHRGIEYYAALRNVRDVVPRLLDLFEKYEVACTWATVGALCGETIEDFKGCMPEALPSYVEKKYSPYSQLEQLSCLDPSILFAPDLVSLIRKYPNQEFASHTFSHFYCLEDGQTLQQFDADCVAFSKIAKYSVSSLVFPRNQFNPEYLAVCKKHGFIVYRGNPKHWAYLAETRGQRDIVKRVFRFLDAYIPLSGSLGQRIGVDPLSGMADVPASLFLRPYTKKLRYVDFIKVARIKWSMKQVALKGGLFHLWFHPHNFGTYVEENFSMLEDILIYYSKLRKEYGFKSATMKGVAEEYLRG